MKEKNDIYKKSKSKIAYITPICAVLMLLSTFLPYMSYIYKKTRCGLIGLDFLLGKEIGGGKITIVKNTPLLISLLVIVGILIISFFYNKFHVAISARILCLLSLIVIVCNLFVLSKIDKILRGLSQPKLEYGGIIVILLGLAILMQNLYVLWREKVLYTLDFMIIPGLLYFIVNNYIPMAGLLIAFKKIDYRIGIFKSPWVGFDNFSILFSKTGSFFTSDVFIITRNTLLYNFTFILISTIMGIIVGICLGDLFSKSWQKFFQTSILLPQLISMVIVAYIGYAFFSNEAGMINSVLGKENSINFYATPKYWPFILTFVFVWKQIGYSAIIFLSSIVGIDRSLYEAADVDGANKVKQIMYITLPMLKPTIVTLVLLQVGRIFYSDFGLFYQVPMNSGALYNVTNTIDTYVYRALMVSNNISTASAVSVYQAVVGFILVFTVNILVKKFDSENALF